MFYAKILNADTALFDATEKRHAIDVLRKNAGDLITFTNGQGYLYEASIKQVNKDSFSAEITSELSFRPKPKVHLAIAPTKNSDRMEWMLEKCCELGLASLQFLDCAHSEKTRVNMERMERVALSAIKQSGNLWLPELLPVTKFNTWIQQPFEGKRYLAHCAEGEKNRAAHTEEAVCIGIGPEGDFSSEEIQLALERGCLPLSLGNTRLRTETAGLVACTLFNLL
ncbi:MAG: 16S rRNA (uracil(1498)-N(3))-methyltransferase [Bacteroidetes bacterium]|nr:16S rRNA (uracil(1498)-N(3))-methyltransferase [Bacteroidota bacterium]